MGTLSEYQSSSGLTQRALAERLKISKSFLNEILRGEKAPSVSTAIRIAEATDGAVPITSWPKYRVFAQTHTPSSQPSSKREAS